MLRKLTQNLFGPQKYHCILKMILREVMYNNIYLQKYIRKKNQEITVLK